MEKWIHVTAEFEGFHTWPDAPDEVAFLRNNHRHIFKVKLSMTVKHLDRELEFFMVQRKLISHIMWMNSRREFANNVGSCEMIAENICYWAKKEYSGRKYKCEVSEDGENSAEIIL